MFNNFPDWVMAEIVANQLPWTEAQAVSAPEFFSIHSLHQSEFQGLWVQPNARTTAIIQWDLAIASTEAPDSFPNITGEVQRQADPDWYNPMLLLIDFGILLHQINLLPAAHSDGDVASMLIARSEASAVSLDTQEELYNALVQHPLLPEKTIDYTLSAKLCHTAIYGADKVSQVHLFHHQQIRVLGINSEGTYLHIPSLTE